MELKSYEKLATVDAINDLAHDINLWARDKGFWNVPESLRVLMRDEPVIERFVSDLIKVRKAALVTTETSEQVEAIRKPETVAGVSGFSNECEEVADQVIRLLDYAGEYRMPLGECISAKMKKNENRPHLHGKSF